MISFDPVDVAFAIFLLLMLPAALLFARLMLGLEEPQQ